MEEDAHSRADAGSAVG
jgi:hypothetical protein